MNRVARAVLAFVGALGGIALLGVLVAISAFWWLVSTGAEIERQRLAELEAHMPNACATATAAAERARAQLDADEVDAARATTEAAAAAFSAYLELDRTAYGPELGAAQAALRDLEAYFRVVDLVEQAPDPSATALDDELEQALEDLAALADPLVSSKHVAKLRKAVERRRRELAPQVKSEAAAAELLARCGPRKPRSTSARTRSRRTTFRGTDHALRPPRPARRVRRLRQRHGHS